MKAELEAAVDNIEYCSCDTVYEIANLKRAAIGSREGRRDAGSEWLGTRGRV